MFEVGLIVTRFLLSFPFLRISLSGLRSLLLLRIGTSQGLLSTCVRFGEFSLPCLLLLLRARFGIIRLLRILRALLRLSIYSALIGSKFYFQVGLRVLLDLFAICISHLLCCLASNRAFDLLLDRVRGLITFPIRFNASQVNGGDQDAIFIYDRLGLRQRNSSTTIPYISKCLRSKNRFAYRRLLLRFRKRTIHFFAISARCYRFFM